MEKKPVEVQAEAEPLTKTYSGGWDGLYDHKAPESKTPLVPQDHHEAPANNAMSNLAKGIYKASKEHLTKTDDAQIDEIFNSYSHMGQGEDSVR